LTRKVFAIGWHKTGTTTIGQALHLLGYRVVGCRLDLAWPLLDGEREPALELAAQFDACQDVPWAALFKHLDERFPGSLFIHTIRSESSWLESARNHFANTEIPLHRWLYGHGRLQGNEECYLKRYRSHNEEVRDHFKSRQTSLLTVNLEEGMSWKGLCQFLNCPEPARPFPHSNKSIASMRNTQRFLEGSKSALPAPVRRFGSNFKRLLYTVAGKEWNPDIFHNQAQNKREIRRYKSAPENR